MAPRGQPLINEGCHSPPDFDTDWSPASVGWFFIHRFGMDLLSGFFTNFLGVDGLNLWSLEGEPIKPPNPGFTKRYHLWRIPGFTWALLAELHFATWWLSNTRKERQITTPHVEDVEHVYVNIYIYMIYVNIYIYRFVEVIECRRSKGVFERG